MIQLRGFLGKRGEIDGIRQHLFAGLPCGALASLRPGPPLGPLLLRLSDLPPGDRGHLLLLFEKGKGKELHPVGGRGGAHPEPVSAGLHLRGGILF